MLPQGRRDVGRYISLLVTSAATGTTGITRSSASFLVFLFTGVSSCFRNLISYGYVLLVVVGDWATRTIYSCTVVKIIISYTRLD